MIVEFPSLSALELALSAGAIPATTAAQRVRATPATDGPIRVQPARALSRTVLKKIAPWGGVEVSGEFDLSFDARCWPQLLPLVRERAAGAQGVMLLALADAAALPILVGEMLRLGNDRQSYRELPGSSLAAALLRVVDPPYYTLLRTLEENSGMRVFVERSPGVWIEWGYRHPLETRLKPAKGEILLLSGERDWQSLPDAPLTDAYDAVEFTLPPMAPAALVDRPPAQRIQVPLRLAKTTTCNEPAELWVLPGGYSAVNELVHNADDRLLARLAFAVGEPPGGGEATIVLRARPTREPPPVIELDAIAFRPYLKLPNLFAPCNSRLHPPLRRDAAARLLAGDQGRITWLHPGEGGAFRVESLPDDAFRPLSDWVEYVFDHDRQALDAWRASCQFDFAPFVVDEERTAPPLAAPPPSRHSAAMPADSGVIERSKSRPAPKPAPLRKRKATRAQEGAAAATPRKESTQTGELQAELRGAEQKFRDSAAPLDSLERALLWKKLAILNARLGQRPEAVIAWSNAVWDHRQAVDILTDEPLSGLAPDAAEAQRLATSPAPTSAEAGLVAAWLLSPAPLPPDLAAPAAAFLEKHEQRLPVRVAWLAWLAVARASYGDVLALARARDRLLRQIFQYGLRPSHDVASFIRSLAGKDSPQLEEMRGLLARLHADVAQWLETGCSTGRTSECADLLFACAFARLGDRPAAEELIQRVLRNDLRREAPQVRLVHEWLRDAFAWRVVQTINGESQGPLGEPLLARLNAMKQRPDRQPAYMAERLREHLSLLEPAGRASEAHPALAPVEEAAGERLEVRLLAEAEQSRQALMQGLDLAPRFGEDFGAQMLRRTDALLFGSDELPLADRASLLGRALFTTAHFGNAERFAALAKYFEQQLAGFVSAYLDDPRRHGPPEAQDAAHQAVAAIEGLFVKALCGMRKLGNAEWIRRLISAMENAAERRPKAETAADLERARRLILRMHIAAGRFAFGENDIAVATLREVRHVLAGEGMGPLAKTNAACRYARTWGHAPLALAGPALLDLFHVVAEGTERRRGVTLVDEQHRTIRSEDAYFSLFDLRLIDAALSALVGDEFLLGAEARRWLEEDEFLVRRRIHLDMRDALASV
jgi:hypothetical protein